MAGGQFNTLSARLDRWAVEHLKGPQAHTDHAAGWPSTTLLGRVVAMGPEAATARSNTRARRGGQTMSSEAEATERAVHWLLRKDPLLWEVVACEHLGLVDGVMQSALVDDQSCARALATSVPTYRTRLRTAYTKLEAYLDGHDEST